MSRWPAVRIPSSQSGVSLVELLLALGITAMVMVPMLGLLRTTGATSSQVKPRFDLEREADFAVQRIAAQVRGGAPIANYSLDGDKLIEKNGTVVSTLAESVTAFSQSTPAAAAGQQLVLVSLTLARDGASASAAATVRAGGAR
jgi:Tfp pilus assembly protein PilW